MAERTTRRVTTVDRVTDVTTGEIVDEQVTTRETSVEPDYVKLYIKAWLAFKGSDNVDTRLLTTLFSYMTYASDEQRIYLNATQKEIIAAQLGWSGTRRQIQQRWQRELKRLVDAGVLLRVTTPDGKIARGTWTVNPELVGKGSWADVRRLRATFSIVGRDAGHVTVDVTST